MIVLDTHVVIWEALLPEKLSTGARRAINRARKTNQVVVSNITLWEIAMLISKGRLTIDAPYLDFIDLIKNAHRYSFRGITPEIADLSVKFPTTYSPDPADRLIGATALALKALLVTADANLRKSRAIRTIW